MKESEIIQAFFKGHFLPEDDCHYLPPDQLVTTDSLAEGTHFLHKWSSPSQLAEKLIEVNVSDIAASGGKPTLCLLNLGLSELSKQDDWVRAFSSAFRKRLQAYDMKLVGGDTFFSKNTHLTLTVFGKCKKPWTRSGARDGDHLYLTGNVGNSELGLHALQKNISRKEFKAAITKHLTPKSRVSLVPFLKKYEIHACMDLTDGLIQDTERLALAAKGSIVIDLKSLPVSKLAFQTLGWDGVLGSGEELELLFLSADILPSKIGNVKCTKIGEFHKNKSNKHYAVTFRQGDEIYLPRQKGFLHF